MIWVTPSAAITGQPDLMPPVSGSVNGHLAPRVLHHRRPVAPRSYQVREAFNALTASSITGTSISTPTTVASAAPDLNPNRLMAAATASSKKLEAPISAEGQATLCVSPAFLFIQ